MAYTCQKWFLGGQTKRQKKQGERNLSRDLRGCTLQGTRLPRIISVKSLNKRNNPANNNCNYHSWGWCQYPRCYKILSKMFSFLQKIVRHVKKQEHAIHTQEKKQTIDCVWRGPVSDLIDKDYKTAVMNMFKELKQIILTALKKNMIPMSHQKKISTKR